MVKRRTANKKSKTAVESTEFFKQAKKYFIKVKDITKLKKGDCIELFFFDRNFFDAVYNYHNKTGKVSVNIKDLYNGNYGYAGVYRHDHDLQGDFLWFIDRSTGNSHRGGCPVPGFNESFEFHLNYYKGNWYPLKNGKLPKGGGRLGLPGQFKELRGKSYTEFPKSTLVGWRGEAIRVSDLDKLPNLKYEL